MKKITAIILLILLNTLFFIGCTSDSSSDVPASQESTGDYWPTTIDNNWIYYQNDQEILIKIVSIDEINGSKYYKFNQMLGFESILDYQTSMWIKKEKGDYFLKIDDINIDYGGITGKISGYEMLLFKDYLDVNQTWEGSVKHTTSYDIPNFPAIITTINYTGKIIEKGSTITVKDKVYKDVIKFKLTQIASASGQITEVSTYYWIAKNVGIIKTENNGSISELKSYTIK